MRIGTEKSWLKTASISALALGLVVGCSGGSSNGSSGSSGSTGGGGSSGGSSFSLAGTVSKGIILNGYVTVTDAEDDTNVLVSGQRTSATDGSYNVAIPASANFTGSAVKVTVTGGAGAQLVCDSPSGCGGSIAFGDPFDIDDTVSLTAIIGAPEDNASATVHVTAITSLAASLAEDNAAGGTIDLTVVETANSQVADLFGLQTTDLSSIPAVDITDPTTEATEEELLAAAVNAGIMEALVESGDPLGTAIDDLNTEFATNDGQIVGNEDGDDPDTISLEDILSGGVDALNQSGAGGENNNSVTSQLEGEETELQSEEPGELTDSTPSPTAGQSAIDKGKAFVSDLQLINTVLSDPTLSMDFETFFDSVDTAADAVSGNTEFIFNAFSSAMLDFDQAYAETLAAEGTPPAMQQVGSGNTVGVSVTNDIVTLTLTDASYIEGIVDLSLTLVVDSSLVEETLETLRGNARLAENPTTDTIDLPYGLITGMATAGDLTSDLSGTVSAGTTTLAINDLSLGLDEFDYQSFNDTAEYAGIYAFLGGVTDEFLAYVDEINLAVGALTLGIDGTLSDTASGASLSGAFGTNLMSVDVSSLRTYAFATDLILLPAQEGLLFSSAFYDATASALSFGLGSGTISFAGDVTSGMETVGVSLSASLASDNFEISVAPATYSNTYTVDTMTQTLSFDYEGTRTGTIALLTAEEAATELEALIAGFEVPTPPTEPLAVNDPSYGAATFDPESGLVTFIEYKIVDPTLPVFKREATIPALNTKFVGFVQLFDIDELYEALALGGVTDLLEITDPQFVYPVPLDDTSIVDYMNNASDIIFGYGISCESNQLLFNGQLLEVEESGGSWSGFVLADPFPCVTTNPALSEFLSVSTELSTGDFRNPDEVIVGDRDVELLYSASLSEDVVGIDPQDPEVTLSVFGTATATESVEDVYALDSTVSTASFRIEFAGRSFELSALGFDDLDNEAFTWPLVVTNQDGVVLTLKETESGDVTGTLVLDGETLANITEPSDGVILVTFTDPEQSEVTLQ